MLEPSRNTVTEILEREAALKTRVAAALREADARLAAALAEQAQMLAQAEADGRASGERELAIALQQLTDEKTAKFAAVTQAVERYVKQAAARFDEAATHILEVVTGEET